MAITKFQFHDRLRDWTLNEMSLTNFNLLVGLSGVGKTRFLVKLDAVRHAAVFQTDKVNGCEWTIELISEGVKYSWSAKTSSVPGDPSSRYGKTGEKDLPNFLSEQIIRGDGVKLVERAKDRFIFMGKPLPKLKNTESAVSLLRDEESIAPLYRAFCRFFHSRVADVLTGSTVSE